jgi:hypothetical protein
MCREYDSVIDGCKLDAFIVEQNRKTSFEINVTFRPMQCAMIGLCVGDVFKLPNVPLTYKIIRIYEKSAPPPPPGPEPSLPKPGPIPSYTYQQIENMFGISIYPFGKGINPTETRVVLISVVSKKQESFVYHDGWMHNGDYMYSGEGKRGDQTLTKGNREIINAKRFGKTIHLLTKFSSKEYYYQGIFELDSYTYEDQEDDPYFKKGINLWDNTVSNAFSLMRLANGGVIRINECRRIGWKAPSSFVSSFYGTKGGYQFSNAQHVFVKHTDDGVQLEDVSDYVNPREMTANRDLPDFKNQVANHTWQWDSHAPIQDDQRLPAEFDGMANGHMASHKFLVDDFCTAAYNGTLPTVNAWLAARFTVPGIVAFESIKQDGQPMEVPDFGDPPANW